MLQPIHKMKTPVRMFSNVLASRLAFEALLLEESGSNSRYSARDDTVEVSDSRELAQELPMSPVDLAEPFFPRENRYGEGKSEFLLGVILVSLLVAIGATLRMRDIH
jgi:hypothetical protein